MEVLRRGNILKTSSQEESSRRNRYEVVTKSCYPGLGARYSLPEGHTDMPPCSHGKRRQY